MKRKLKKLTALLLSILMVTSMLTELLPTAFAAEGSGSAPMAAPAEEKANADAGSPDTGRPNLYVDFLGDNNHYVAGGGAAGLNTLKVPGAVDQNKNTNPGGGGTWVGYPQEQVEAGTIFWIGVGLDRMNVLDLLRQENNGLASLELGFYYNSDYIEPYTGTDGNYKAVIENANITNSSFDSKLLWGSDYEVVTALTGIAPQTDAVTQETLADPSMGTILGDGVNPNPWKMTYVALEKKPGATGDNRFKGIHDGVFHPVDASDLAPNAPTNYVLLIPFRLKAYDHKHEKELSLRLARNATHFSMGGGSLGAEPYAAWERVTVRNDQRELKLMTNFRGDLDIFGGKRRQDTTLNADLIVTTAGGSGNTAALSITNDPSPNPVRITGMAANDKTITGLTSGVGLTLEVTCDSGFDVTVTVTLKDGTTAHPFTEVTEKEHYTFIMPEDSVIVTVTFSLNGATDFWSYLKEDRTQEKSADIAAGAAGVKGNDTVITITKPVAGVVDKNSSTDNPRKLPGGKAEYDQNITIKTTVHEDYCAVVSLFNWATQSNVPPDVIDPSGIIYDTVSKTVTLPAGGTLTLKMPKSDVIAEVRYVPAARHKASLEVYHEAGAAVLPGNAAQLTSTVFTDDSVPMPAYSGVVYHQFDNSATPTFPEDHSAVETPFSTLPKVDASTAAGSGSLGGDGGKTAAGWNDSAASFMALAYAATKAGDLKGKLFPYDLNGVTLDGKAPGLCINAVGECYPDSRMGEFFDRLYEAAQLAKKDGSYKRDVLDVGGKDPTKVLYSYYDLTPEQVQVYLLDYEKYAAKVAGGDATAAKPILRADADAKTELATYTWFTPSTGTTPPTAPDLTTPADGAYLEVRAGRQAELVLRADSAYVVKSIVLHDAAATPTNPDVEIKTRSADYQNVYPFTMPDYDCTVRVTYALRGTYQVELGITDPGNQVDNAVTLTAYIPGTPNTAAQAVSLSASGTIEKVLEGSIVTVKVNKSTGYKASGSVKLTSNSSAIVTDPADTNDMKNGTVFTFVMPAGNVKAGISYTEENVPTNKATVLVENEDGGANTAIWQGTTQTVLPSVTQGTALIAEATIQPGYYVHSVEVYTATRSYAYTLSGNGYNNGSGGGVTVATTMPGADLEVKLTVRKGTPPVESELPLTLRADDPNNAGAGTPTVYDDNWVKAEVAGKAVTLGPVGKGTTGNATMSAMDYVTAGDKVALTFAHAAGYYLKSIEVLPASLGATVEWLSPTTAEFIMPAGSATISVAFTKGDAPALFIDLAKTEQGGGVGENTAKNTVTRFTSPTIDGILHAPYPVPDALPVRVPTSDMSSGAAAAGEKVIMDLSVAPGWYIHSLTVTAGGLRLRNELLNSGWNGGAGGIVQGSFAMPSSDASVTVNYRKGEPPSIKDYQMELVVTDPENRNDGTVGWKVAANNASAAITGATTGSVGPLGVVEKVLRGAAYAKPGDTVTIEYAADSAKGFALDIIIVTPTGLRIVPTYLGGNKASFTMPADSVTAEVRFKKGTAAQYTADLILRAPSDTAIAKVGQGSFGGDYTKKIYSKTAAAGEKVDIALFARDGYYIRNIEVTPAALGVNAGLSGSFGQQSGDFVMPAANVTVNIWFEKLWPGQVKYDLTLAVYDGDNSASSAHFGSIAGTALTPPDSDIVKGGEKKTLTAKALDRDAVFMAIDPAVRYYASEITVTDSRGQAVTWSYAPGGIRFTMPPGHVTIAVRFAEGTHPTHEATLHISAANGATIDTSTLSAAGGGTVSTDGGKLTGIATGTTMTVKSKPTVGKVTSAIAVSASGKQLLVPMNMVTEGGESTFAMPDEDAAVYLLFDNVTIGADDKAATLVVSGPNGSGSAEMTVADPAATTGDVLVGSSGLLFAAKECLVTVDIATANTNIGLASVRVVDGAGAAVPYTWTDAAQRKFTYKMPAKGAAVYVELEDLTPSAASDFTAQVVVNDEAYTGTPASRNTAHLRRALTDAKPGVNLLTPLKAGATVYLDLTVQPGFVVKEILVVPARYGIAPSLTLKPKQDQTTSFVMPADDVVVYVRFAPDELSRERVNLYVKGTPGNPANKGYITSDYSGKKGPVVSGGSNFVWAAYPQTKNGILEPAEWVTVNYAWDNASSIKSITVLDGEGNRVPFTQVNQNQIIFPMVPAKVDVTIEFQNTPVPATYEASLHAVNLDAAGTLGASNATLTWGANTVTAAPGESKKLPVPAGETVDLSAMADTDVYIKAAYVLYEDGGQMLACDLPALPDGTVGWTGTQNTSFVMHPGAVDVYVYFTKAKPTVVEHAAVLMLDGLAADTESKAVMTHSGANSVTVEVNGDHGYVTAETDETITVVVVPGNGYTIDTILLTPLGIMDQHGGAIKYTQNGNTFYFTMPASNVAARVVLKATSAAEYKATLHYKMATDPVTATNPATDWASLTYTGTDGQSVTWKTDGGVRTVLEGTELTLDVSMDIPNVVLAAYVLKGGALVPLDKALEGTKEGSSADDNDLADATAKFIMPSADVDVFVWFTDTPPTTPWRTAVLTVTDENDKGELNSKSNFAEIKTDKSHTTAKEVRSGGVPTHAFLPVAETEVVTVTVGSPAPKYEFQRPATITHSLAGTTLGLTQGGSSPNYTYTYAVGAFNSAVAVHFKSTAVTENGLNVVAVDRDNPGDDSVTNNIKVTPAGMSELNLDSTTSAGARQTVPNVKESTQVGFTVKPAVGYLPVAVLVTGSGATATSKKLALTLQGDGSYTGEAFSMPGKTATLTVTFYKSHKATLSLVNTAEVVDQADQSSRARMKEDAFGGSVNASVIADGEFSTLPGGTALTASMESQAVGTRLAGALLTENGMTTILSATPDVGDYRHTLSLYDAKIQMVVTKDTNTISYLAAVTAKKLPAGCAAPTIQADPVNSAAGQGWTVANTGETVTAHVEVPTGYRADVTASGIALTPDPTQLTATGNVTFTMPAGNVQVTVTYVKTAFTAELVTVGDSGSSTLDTVSNNGVLTNLAAGAVLPYTATPNTDKVASAIILTTASGSTQYLHSTDSAAALTGNLTMPADDVTLTVVFGGDATAPDKLYTATVATVGTDDLEGNAAQGIENDSLIPPATLPKGTMWAGGYQDHIMRVTFTTEPEYTAVVTAATAGGVSVPVLQQDVNGAGTAYVTMPAADVVVTITYYGPDSPPPVLPEHNLTLTLDGHGGEAENKAVLSYAGGEITANGNNKPTDTALAAAKLGVNLDLSADRKSDYTIVKATIEAKGVVTELDLNRYGTNATSLFFMPDADATVTVYYQKVYTATLQIAGGDAVAGDKVSMTDDRNGTTPVTASGERLERLLGDKETIQTTATAGTDRKLVGVLKTTANTGASIVTPPGAGATSHDFKMPFEDVTVTAVFQGDTKYHLAMVTLDPDSAPGGGSVSVANKGDLTAPSGPFWTAAEKDDGVEVGITLTAGYQAVITSAVGRPSGNAIYVNRTRFTASTTDKSAVFSMPDEDAVITVKFVKGYTASLEITDIPKLGATSTAAVSAGGVTVTGTSDGTNPPTYTNDKTPPEAVNGIPELADGASVNYAATPDAGLTATVVKTTAKSGTVTLPTDLTTIPFPIAGEDVTVGVILRDVNDRNKQLAKVVLKGESDIVGNGDRAKIADLSAPTPNGTAAGNIWTTTKDSNTVTLTLSVAKGYVAEITATQDDAAHTPITTLNNGTDTGALVGIGFTGSDPHISDPQTVTFIMPPGSTEDVTVYVEYRNAGTIPAPYDPVRAADGKLELGHIYGVNQGGQAVITIPTLKDSGGLYNASQYSDDDAATVVAFRFYLYDKATGAYTPLEDDDAVLAPYDPNTLVKPGDPYNYGNYYTSTGADPVAYTGAQFTLTPKGGSAQATALADILNNDGSLNADGDTQLYVRAWNTRAEKSAYVQVLVKPYYELTGTFISYAPTHEATASLYALKSDVDASIPANLTEPSNYETTAFTADKITEETGTGLWQQDISLKSSELNGVYMLVLEKAGHITYTRVNIALNPVNPAEVFTIEDKITLTPGDIDGGGRVNLWDRDLVVDYLDGACVGEWSKEKDKTQPGWATSIYNPETEVYRCDMDGDGNITTHDRDIVEDYQGWSTKNYEVGKDLPSGLDLGASIDLILEELLPPAEEPLDPDMTVDPEPPTEPETPVKPDVPPEPEKPADPALPVNPTPPEVVPPKPDDPKDPALPPETPDDGGDAPPPSEGEGSGDALPGEPKP